MKIPTPIRAIPIALSVVFALTAQPLGVAHAQDPAAIDGGENGVCMRKDYKAPTEVREEFESSQVFRCAREGEGSIPTAFLYRVSLSGPSEGVDVAYLVQSSWRGKLDGVASCEAPAYAPILAGREGVALKCRLTTGGFPYIAFAIAIDDRLFVAEGAPGMATVLVRAIAADAGLTLSPGDFDAARALASEASGGLAVSAADIAQYTLLMQQALLANREFDFAAAARHYREALDLHEELFGRDEGAETDWAASRADLLAHMALELSNQGRFVDAEQLFERASGLLSAATPRHLVADLRTYLAIHNANQGERETALRLAQEASTIRRELSAAYLEKATARRRQNPDDRAIIEQDPNFIDASARLALANIAASENITGLLFERLGGLDDAITAYTRADFALQMSQTDFIGDITTALFRQQLYGNWANALIDAGEARKALAILETAEAGGGTAARGTRVEALNVIARARAKAALGDEQGAIAIAESGFEILRGLAADAKYANVDLPRVAFYFDAVAAAAKRNPESASEAIRTAFYNAQHVGEASVTAERLIAASYIQQRETSNPDIRKAIDAFEAAQFRRQRAEVEFAYVASQPRLSDGTRIDAEMLENFRLALVEATSAQERSREMIDDLFPEYFALSNQRAAMAEVQSALRSNEAMVRFLVGDAGAYGFAVSRENALVYRIALTAEDVAAAVSELRAPIEANASRPFDVPAAAGLYASLLASAEPVIGAHDRLIVAPEGSLLRLPMGVLVRSAGGAAPNGDYSGVDFLARSKTLVVTPSINAFVVQRSSAPSNASNPFLAFADFTPPGASHLGGQNASLRCGDTELTAASFAPLPETYDEALGVARSLGADEEAVLARNKFTKQNFESRASSLDQFRVLYFATHGFLPYEFTCGAEPGLLMSYTAGVNANDLVLTAPEIMRLELDADLVVLSACNTAGGGIADQRSRVGESLSGLVRAFFQAGARSVMATHWSVPSERSMELMIDAFGEVGAAGGDYAAALRAAQINMIEAGGEFSHPFYWAAYTINGAVASDKQVSALDLGARASRN